MKTYLKFLSGLACAALFVPSLVSAQILHPRDLHPLTGEDLFFTFSDNVMIGIYKQPRERSGTSQFSEHYKSDGTLRYNEGAIEDTGQWVVNTDQICFQYDGELSGGVSCFYVFQVGSCYYSYAPRNVRNGKPISPNAWSVKTKTDGELAICEDLMG